MECACTVPMGDYDCVQLIHTKPRTAKVHHICNECKGTILPGCWYEREVYKSGRKIRVHKTCEDCWSVRQVFFSDGWFYGMVWDQMQEFIDECDGDISVPCIKMVSKLARDRILDMIEEVWER